MTNEIYSYIVKLPPGIKEAVLPCAGGYTVYIADRLSHPEQIAAFRHALEHINSDDWSESNVQEIEKRAHQCQK